MAFAPLKGVRVADVTTSIAGPYCTYILGLLGADVVKVERPGAGDDTRGWGPPFWNGESPVYLAANGEKRSIAVDLKSNRGIEVIRRLVGGADVFVENFRPGLAERLGLGFDALTAVNPRLVYCSIGAFGRKGPLSDQPGYDPLMQAAAGIMSITGERGGEPVRAGVSLVDQGTALWSAIAVLAALRTRDAGAAAQRIDTSLFEVAVNWVPYQLLGYLGSGVVPSAQGSGISILAPYEAFETRDGRVMIAAGNDRLFERLCDALDLQHLREDAAYATNAGRVERRAQLARELSSHVARQTTAEVLDRLTRHGVPAAPVSTIADVSQHEQTQALGLLQPLPHDSIVDFVSVASPLAINGERVGLTKAAPRLGADTVSVLRELGFAHDAIDDLIRDSVVEAAPLLDVGA